MTNAKLEPMGEGFHNTRLATATLIMGQEVGVNARKTNRDDNLAELEASIIREKGILQPILVWRDTDGDGRDYIIDGSRRVTACVNLIKKKPEGFAEIEGGLDTIPALLTVGGTAADAQRRSLATNMMRLPFHPVDQFEAFVELTHRLETEEEQIAEIRRQFGVTKIIAERRLALGSLHKDIRNAWRKDEISAETAAAFTLTKDAALQLRIFKKMKGPQLRGNGWNVRREIVGDLQGVGPMLNFVTPEAYKLAGGAVIRDLFAEKDGAGDGVSDRELLTRMWNDKIDGIISELREAGWSEVWRANELPASWRYLWKKLGVKKNATADQKKKSGVVLDWNGQELERVYGVVKPREKKPATAKKSKGAKAGRADSNAESADLDVSQKMENALADMATAGVSKALGAQADVAIAAILAGFASHGDGPMRLQLSGMKTRLEGEPDLVEFEDAFKPILKGGKAATQKGIATVAAEALDLLMSGDPLPLQAPGAAAIVSALNAKYLNRHLRDAFDAEAYFAGVSKRVTVAALAESGVIHKSTIPTMMKLTAENAINMAVRDIPKTGWLPMQLRAPGYDGPGPKPAKPVKAAAKKKSTR